MIRKTVYARPYNFVVSQTRSVAYTLDKNIDNIESALRSVVRTLHMRDITKIRSVTNGSNVISASGKYHQYTIIIDINAKRNTITLTFPEPLDDLPAIEMALFGTTNFTIIKEDSPFIAPRR